MIQKRNSAHQSTPLNPAVFGILATSITALISVLLFVSKDRDLLLGAGWLVALIGIPVVIYIIWTSPAFAIIILIAGLAFHGAIMNQWGQSESFVVRYWKEILLICMGLLTIFKSVLNPQKLKPLLHSPVFLSACLYATICCVRALFTDDFIVSMTGLAILVLYFIVFLTVALARLTDREITTILHALLVVAVVVGFIGIMEKAFDFHVMKLADQQMVFGESRVASTLGSSLVLASFMAVGVCIAFSFLIKGGRWLLRFFYGGSMGICLVALSLSYTRGGYLQAGISIVVSGYLLYRKKLVSGRSGMILIAVLLLLVAWSGQVLNTTVFTERFQDFARVRGEASNESRVATWKYYYHQIVEDPQVFLYGNGEGTASNTVLDWRHGAMLPESWPLKLAFEAGVLIMLLFYAMYLVCIKSCLSVLRRCPKHTIPSAASLVGILAGLGVYSFVAEPFGSWMISMCFWLIAGMVCVLELRYHENPLPEIEKGRSRVLSPRFVNSTFRARP